MPGVAIFLCIWHVKRAWLKNLIHTVADSKKRQEMLAALDKLMRLNVQLPVEHSDEDLRRYCQEALEGFYKQFADQQAFLQYFKREWAAKIGELYRVDQDKWELQTMLE